MYDKLTIENEPYISMNGELICDEYLPEGNPMNPESPFGLFLYLIIGGGFDEMDNMTSTFIKDCDVISANANSLDRFYGASLGMPRPVIVENNTERLLTDKEYRAYLYLRNCQLVTRLDLLSAFGHCMGDNNSDDEFKGVTITKEVNGVWSSVDHLNYISLDTDSSNIGANTPDDPNRIIAHDDGSDVYTIHGMNSYSGEFVIYVNIPMDGWSPVFLDFLTEFISLKGNVLIREVIR